MCDKVQRPILPISWISGTQRWASEKLIIRKGVTKAWQHQMHETSKDPRKESADMVVEKYTTNAETHKHSVLYRPSSV